MGVKPFIDEDIIHDPDEEMVYFMDEDHVVIEKLRALFEDLKNTRHDMDGHIDWSDIVERFGPLVKR